MPRDYIIRRMADIDENVNGDKIMARKRMDPIGFVRFPEWV